MGILAWWVAPSLASVLDGPEPFCQALWISMTVGLVWQFLLKMGLEWRRRSTQEPPSPKGWGETADDALDQRTSN